MQLTITHQAQPHVLQVDPDATLGALKSRIEEATGIPSDMQKLLPSRSKAKAAQLTASADPEARLQGLGLSDGARIMVVGTTYAQLTQLNAQELSAAAHRQRRPHPSVLRATKARNTHVAKLSPFGTIQARDDAPNSSAEGTNKVQAFLERLATDEAVLHIMELHHLRVGTLTELLPHEHDPSLRGLNENGGARISLRVRIDEQPNDLRDYRSCRQVLLHELAHNKISDHPPEFRELNSLFNTQVNNFEYTRRAGANVLSDARVYSLSSDAEPDVEERRARSALAAETRRLALESEIQEGELAQTRRQYASSAPTAGQGEAAP